MVKSIFKRVSAVAIAGTILTGTMAVPANAKSLVTTTQKVTTTVINENFNGYEQKDHKNLKYDTLSTFPGNEDIQYKHYVSWEGARRMEVEADTVDGRTGNILTFDNNSGIYLNFDNPSGSTPVARGDIVTISFRYKFETNKQSIKVNLNGNTSVNYVGEGGAYDPAVYPPAAGGGGASYGSEPWSSTTEGRLVNLSLKTNTYQVRNDNYKDNVIKPNTWYTMTITINTKDAAQNNTQTIKIDNGDGTYLYGLYDANYTGEGDPTYDPFTEITSLQFTTNGCGGRTDGGTDYVSIDDVTVSVTGDREVSNYASDLSKTPGFEVWGDASEGHDEDNTFTPGQTMTIKASANPISFSENGVINAMLFVAFYNELGRFEGAKITTSKLSKDNPIIESESFSSDKNFTSFLWSADKFSPLAEPKTFITKINPTKATETAGCADSSGVYGRTSDDTVIEMNGTTADGQVFEPQYVYNAEPADGGVKHLSFSTAADGRSYLEADFLTDNKSKRVFNDGLFAILPSGYMRFLDKAITKKNLITGKWYLVDIILDSDNNEAKLYIDGELMATDTLPSYPSNDINGVLFVKKGWEKVYLDEISLTSDNNNPSVTFMSNSPYYANTISKLSDTIDTYSQDSDRFIERLRLDGAADAVILNADGTKCTDSTMSAGKYLRVTTDEGKSLYYITKAGSDSYLASLDSIDITNEASCDTDNFYIYEQPDFAELNGSPLDVSFVLDKPAGKYGYVKRSGDKFVFENTNKEIKFWGTNISDKNWFLEKEDAEACADRIAQMGFNLVRVHKIDYISADKGILWLNPDTNKVEIDPVKMDKLCYFLAELKERGVYWYFDIQCGRPIYEQDEVDYHDTTSLFPAAFWNQSLIDLQNKYAEEILTYYNKYTAMRIVDDPALAMVDMNNEKTAYPSKVEFTGRYYDELNNKFTAWVKARYNNRKELDAAWQPTGWWNIGLLDDEDPWKENMPVKVMDENKDDGMCRGRFGQGRSADVVEFLYDIEASYYKQRKEYFENVIGTKCPVSGGTSFTANAIENGHALSYTDFRPIHEYWAGGDTNLQTAGKVFDGRSHFEDSDFGLIGYVSRSNVYGMPLILDEWNTCMPNSYVSEGPLLVSAYSSLNNWNATSFAFNTTIYSNYLKPDKEYMWSSVYSVYESPIHAAVYPSASTMFQRGDVTESASGYYETVDRDDMFVGLDHDNGIYISINFLPNKVGSRRGLIGKTGSVYAFDGLNNGLVNDQAVKNKTDAADNGDRKYVSNTGELMTDLNNKFFTADTNGTQAVSGFIGGKQVDLSNLSVKLNNEFATATLTSIDKENGNIETANKLLLTLAGNSTVYCQILQRDPENGKQTTTLKVPGKSQLLVEQIMGEVTLKLDGNYSVYALTSSGKRKKQVAITPVNGGFKFNVTRDMETMHFEIVKN